MKFHRSSAAIAALVAALAWGVKAPLLLEMMRAGEISPMAFMLYVAATIAMAAGGLRVGFGKSGRLSFLLHIVFACLASLVTRLLLGFPFVLSVSVAIVVLAWSFAAQRSAASDARSAQP